MENWRKMALFRASKRHFSALSSGGDTPQGRSRLTFRSADQHRHERQQAAGSAIERHFGVREQPGRSSSTRRPYCLELPEEFVRCARHMPHDGALG